MWRLCDLHYHTTPNEQCEDEFSASAFVQSCLDADLHVVAVTDHDHADHLDAIHEAALESGLEVVAGVEISTDRGHVIALAPGGNGPGVVRELITRVSARPDHQVDINDLLQAVRGTRTNGRPFAESVVTIGAHVDQDGCLLASSNTLGLDGQILLARQLDALEVAREEVLTEWLAGGVKQSGQELPLLKGSDTHDPANRRAAATWLYLPTVTARDFRHSFAIPRASMRPVGSPPTGPDYVIKSITIAGGLHDGITFQFSERTNAIIGPPNSGKSLFVDCLKFVFDMTCDIDEVERVCRSRMATQLPDGATVLATVATPDGPVSWERTVGAGRLPEPPFRPIVFSQTELTRRAHASQPAIQLLDVHAPATKTATVDIENAASAVTELFLELAAVADEANELRSVVTNPEDGLAAIKSTLEELAGTEDAAHAATDAEKVATWRTRVEEELERWANEAAPEGPSIPAAPNLSEHGKVLDAYLPHRAAIELASGTAQKLQDAMDEVGAHIQALLTSTQEGFVAARSQIRTELAEAGFAKGSEVEDKLTNLRRHVAELEESSLALGEMERTLDEGLVELRQRLDTAQQGREVLSEHRREACGRINESMRSFFAAIDPAGDPTRLDSLFEDLKTGTRLRPETRRRALERLDRFRVLEFAIRLLQGVALSSNETTDEQDAVVTEALDRDKRDELSDRRHKLAELACLFPGDVLQLGWKETSPPTPFHELTEGLRALAVKEISFSASDLPVVSDQPEDAVPTRAVFTSLVPTLRAQRSGRQFIVISHDANIVVASDVEQITILQGSDDGSPYSGDLFDPVVSSAALEHLEGGREAFAIRATHYGRLRFDEASSPDLVEELTKRE